MLRQHSPFEAHPRASAVTDDELSIDVGAGHVGAVVDRPTTVDRRELLVFAHGAGGHRADRGMVALAAVFRALGLTVVRFNFPYRESGRGRPDPMPRLMACIAAVTERALQETGPMKVIIGGRSMGGRAASMLAADGFGCDRLLLLAYPLHPAGQPGKLRDAHLARIKVPVLCCNGTRDALCGRDRMEAVVERLAAHWRMHWLDGADHAFHVLRSSGRSDEDVLEEIGVATRCWLDEAGPSDR